MNKKILAIDFGTKRVGVAVSRMWLAEPLVVLDTETAVQKVVALIAEEQADVLLIGIADGPMVEGARNFAKEVQKVVSIDVVETDETLSSVETHAKLATSGMPRAKRQGPIDHYAAAAFLQEYLDTHREE